MTPLCFVADVHVGNPKSHGGVMTAGVNVRAEFVLQALNEAVDRANEFKARLVVLGDLFDYSRPEAQIIARVQKALMRNTAGAIVLLGNHDMVTTAKGDNALAPLFSLVEIVDAPALLKLEGVDLVCIPFRPGPAVEWLPEAVMAAVQGEPSTPGSSASPPKVLSLHLGLQDDSTAPWLQNSHDSVPVSLVAALCKKWGFSACYAGNWHDRKVWEIDGVHIEQVGALHPTGWNNPGLEYGYVGQWAHRPLKPVEVGGARFIKVGCVEDLQQISGDKSFFVQSAVPIEIEPEVTSALLNFQSSGKVVAWEHNRTSTIEESEAARGAILAARESAKRGGDAVAEYISALIFEEDIDKAQLLEKVRSFLDGGVS